MRIDLLRPESVALALALSLTISLTVPGFDAETPRAPAPATSPSPAAPTLPGAHPAAGPSGAFAGPGPAARAETEGLPARGVGPAGPTARP